MAQIHAKIPIGKKDQYLVQHQYSEDLRQRKWQTITNPSKARQLKQKKTMQPTTIATTTTITTKTSDLPPVGALIPSVFWRRNRVSSIQRRDSIGIHVYMTLFGHHCLIWSYIKPLLPSLSLFDFCIAFDVQFSTMPWILPACILKCF